VSGRRAVFLDRDGVVNELVPDPVTGNPESPLRVHDVRLVPGAATAVSDLKRAGYLVISVSNQPAAAKGLVSEADLATVQRRVVEILGASGAEFDDSEWCLHHPDATVERLRGPCPCRKPAPGMLLHAAGQHAVDLAASWMVGDTDADIEAGRAAGCRTVLVTHSGSAHKRRGDVAPDYQVADLAEAARTIVSVDHGRAP